MKVSKQVFDPQDVLARLRSENIRSQSLSGIMQVYEEGIGRLTKQMNGILAYGGNQCSMLADEPVVGGRSASTSLGTTQSSFSSQEGLFVRVGGDDSKGDIPLQRSQSLAQREVKSINWKGQAQAMESQWNLEREQRERLEANCESFKNECESMKEQYKILKEQFEKQIVSIHKKDDIIDKQQRQIDKLKAIEIQHVSTIKLMQEQLEKKIIQLSEIEADRNQLIERYLLEKTQFAEKMNDLNRMQDDLHTKMGRLAEDEEYLMKGKLNLKTQIQISGVKIPTIAPTIEDSKIVLTEYSEVPSRPQKTFLKLHKNEIYSISSTLNGNLISTSGGDNQIKLYDPMSMNSHGIITSSREDTLFLSTMFAPFNELMIAGLTDKTVQLYNYQTCKLRSTLQGHDDRVNVVSFSSEKEKVISGSADRSIKIWDVNKGSSLKSIPCGSIVRSIDYFQSEPHFVTGHNDGSLRIYSVRDNANIKPIINIKGVFDGGITSVRLSNCHNYVLASSTDGFAVKSIDLRKGELFKSYENQSYFNNHEFNKCCFGPDDKYVIAGSSDNSILIWEFLTGKKKAILKSPQHQGVIVVVDFHNITGNLFSGDSRGNLVVWK